MTHIPRTRSYDGPHILSYGFRPFFLLGSLFAGAAILLWLPAFFGEISLPTAFAPRDWHVHEMLFGFLPAVTTGFLLTAIPNWTGRLPLQGTSLFVLVISWMVGRMACATSALFGAPLAAAVDVAFLALVTSAALREVIAGKNWRNLRVIAVLSLLLVGNVLFHAEAYWTGAAEYGIRVGLSAMALLIALIGGRIIPSFTRNWLARENPGRLPAPFDWFDITTMIVTAAAFAAWTLHTSGASTTLLLALAGLAHAVRLARWAGDRTWRDPLLLVLHVAYSFMPISLLLLAASSAGLLSASAGIHALAVGCAGMMTLAVMSRASLGHTGRALVASRPVQVIYSLVAVAALARVTATVVPSATILLLHVTAAAWILAFWGFSLAYWKVFTGPRFVR